MAYDLELADRIREQLASTKGVTEKAMFGGLAFLVNGNMAVSASGRGGLLLRCDPDRTAKLVNGTTVDRGVRLEPPLLSAAGRWTAGYASTRPRSGPNRNWRSGSELASTTPNRFPRSDHALINRPPRSIFEPRGLLINAVWRHAGARLAW